MEQSETLILQDIMKGIDFYDSQIISFSWPICLKNCKTNYDLNDQEFELGHNHF
jgi:hypothetical protein